MLDWLSDDFAGPRSPRHFVLGEPQAQLTNLIHRDLVVLEGGFAQGKELGGLVFVHERFLLAVPDMRPGREQGRSPSSSSIRPCRSHPTRASGVAHLD